MVAQIFPRWNPVTSWLRQVEHFKKVAEVVQHVRAVAPALDDRMKGIVPLPG
jgi:hypothetical protein